MVTVLAVAAALTVGLLIVLLDARRTARRQQRDIEESMSGLVSDKGRATLDEIALIVDQNKHVLGRYHARSRAFYEARSYAEAVEWLRYGCEAIEALAPDFLTALRKLRIVTRRVSVIVALPPLRPYAFRAWELRGLAGLAGVLHNLLVTGHQRVRLRLRVLAYAFGMALRWLRRSTDHVTARPEAEAHWKRIDDLVGDLGTTGDEALLTAERLVQALDAVEMPSASGGQPLAVTKTAGSS